LVWNTSDFFWAGRGRRWVGFLWSIELADK
jgi:hypothetical protein